VDHGLPTPTPSLSLMMNVRAEVPFEPGKAYTLTFDDGE
jgi:hypothetical protein